MPSQIEILNGSLILVSEDLITSLEDGSTNAKICKVLWPTTRDAVLRMHPWNFAVTRKVLSPDTDSPVYGYSYAFTLPPDLLRILSIDGNTDYKIEGRKILCNDSAVSLRYIYRNTTINEYDSLFIEAFQIYFAYKISYPITKSAALKSELGSLFTNIFKIGKSIDAMEEPQDTIGDFSLLNIRSL